MFDRFMIWTVSGADKWIRTLQLATWAIWGVLVVACLYVRWTSGV